MSKESWAAVLKGFDPWAAWKALAELWRREVVIRNAGDSTASFDSLFSGETRVNRQLFAETINEKYPQLLPEGAPSQPPVCLRPEFLFNLLAVGRAGRNQITEVEWTGVMKGCFGLEGAREELAEFKQLLTQKFGNLLGAFSHLRDSEPLA